MAILYKTADQIRSALVYKHPIILRTATGILSDHTCSHFREVDVNWMWWQWFTVDICPYWLYIHNPKAWNYNWILFHWLWLENDNCFQHTFCQSEPFCLAPFDLFYVIGTARLVLYKLKK